MIPRTQARSDPLSEAQARCCEACQFMQGQWQDFSHNAQRTLQQASFSSQQLMEQVSRAAAQHLQSLALAANRRSNAPAFASMSLGARKRRPQPVFDLASSLAQLKQRVSGIPVFTVANTDNEFVLVSGETEGDKKQLGLFFLCESDAKALVDQIHEQNSSLARESKVLEVGLDQVYSFSSGASKQGTEGLTFRFMPDAEEVQQALQVLQEQGHSTPGFTGVPVFQAEGLTVKMDSARFTPVFLSKKDLDAAVQNAQTQRVTQKTQITQAKVDRAQHEYADAVLQVQDVQSSGSRAKAQAEADKAEERLAKYTARLEEVKNDGLPKVEVGTLEEVLTKMENDTDGTWDEIMFVPPGATTK